MRAAHCVATYILCSVKRSVKCEMYNGSLIP